MASPVKKIIGIGLIILGIIGLFLPVLQGFLFIFAGLAVWGDERIISWLKKIRPKRKQKQKKQDGRKKE